MLIGPARRAAHLATLALAAFVAACGVSELPTPKEAQTLVVAVRPGPASWFPGADGTRQGLDHDLIARFAREKDLPLTVVTVSDAGALIERVVAGEAHVGIGGLFRPQSVKPIAATGRTHPPLVWTSGYETAEAVVVHARDGFRPRGLKDLAGAEVAYDESSGIESVLAQVRRDGLSRKVQTFSDRGRRESIIRITWLKVWPVSTISSTSRTSRSSIDCSRSIAIFSSPLLIVPSP